MYIVVILDLTNRIYIPPWVALEGMKELYSKPVQQVVIHYCLYINM